MVQQRRERRHQIELRIEVESAACRLFARSPRRDAGDERMFGDSEVAVEHLRAAAPHQHLLRRRPESRLAARARPRGAVSTRRAHSGRATPGAPGARAGRGSGASASEGTPDPGGRRSHVLAVRLPRRLRRSRLPSTHDRAPRTTRASRDRARRAWPGRVAEIPLRTRRDLRRSEGSPRRRGGPAPQSAPRRWPLRPTGSSPVARRCTP